MGKVTPIHVEVGDRPDLEELRKGLTEEQLRIVGKVMEYTEIELIESLPELNAGVNTSAAKGSFSMTLSIAAAKKSFRATVSSRIRVPREPYEIDMHLDDGQLALGLPELPEPPEPEPGAPPPAEGDDDTSSHWGDDD